MARVPIAENIQRLLNGQDEGHPVQHSISDRYSSFEVAADSLAFEH
jgi:hypothetical protein